MEIWGNIQKVEILDNENYAIRDMDLAIARKLGSKEDANKLKRIAINQCREYVKI